MRVKGLRFRFSDFEFLVSDLGFRVSGYGLRVSAVGFWFEVRGSGVAYQKFAEHAGGPGQDAPGISGIGCRV